MLMLFAPLCMCVFFGNTCVSNITQVMLQTRERGGGRSCETKPHQTHDVVVVVVMLLLSACFRSPVSIMSASRRPFPFILSLSPRWRLHVCVEVTSAALPFSFNFIIFQLLNAPSPPVCQGRLRTCRYYMLLLRFTPAAAAYFYQCAESRIWG